MIVIRGLFWLGLVAYLVPYKTIDSRHAVFEIDAHAIAARVSELPRYCVHHNAPCAAAGQLAGVMAKQGAVLAGFAQGEIKALR